MITDVADDHPVTDRADVTGDLVMHDIPAEPRALTGVRTAVLAWLRRCGLDEDLCQDITLATYEALANSVEHAYERSADTVVRTVGLEARTPRAGEVIIDVTDRGSWVDNGNDPRRGRGLPLIHALAHEASVDSSADGTIVRMRWDAA
ncbi:ATP-binding protein [Rhodococcus sp. BP-349]|uniref:ATP-binding protein n=1 Tax=unclassified Rhodococcus (in: high G+C Gram-positive bacteria) TaxID=192944 RepID=UPI001C9AD7F0|nr:MULTISPECIES: ATP-binding protein [unclassified Rhodococcus (in: high G+C Gram-positive bacteria)]MBY6537463.1 ATP-binding protein [Rhodococcus sp. BP-363]MBY6541800.1 ATP-binding protein [Rhodococcus sp. BP-369]MBY6561030.1 ATP-binding protein [Rhodococcus sp. BP-370]MBY6575322.1 ATP-binding protein [Rhodococcus sp. BP-364]MBY6584623.1 ATP-binding protein [Rhodococcus sp. BP-358]